MPRRSKPTTAAGYRARSESGANSPRARNTARARARGQKGRRSIGKGFGRGRRSY